MAAWMCDIFNLDMIRLSFSQSHRRQRAQAICFSREPRKRAALAMSVLRSRLILTCACMEITVGDIGPLDELPAGRQTYQRSARASLRAKSPYAWCVMKIG